MARAAQGVAAEVSRIVLVRHAQVTQQPDLPPARWPLSEAGLRAAIALRDDPVLADIARFFTSPEPKAVATARAVAARRPVEEVADLRELDRPFGWISDHSEWERVANEIFAREDEHVRGCEPAAEARRRFVAAIDALTTRFPRETIGVVAHGMVLALYLARLRGRPAALADLVRIGFPDRAVVDHAAGKILVDFTGMELKA